MHLLRLSASASLKEKRLASLLDGRSPPESRLVEAVENAQVLGSLELAGVPATHAEPLFTALRAVDPAAPLTVAALRSWNAALTGGTGVFRTSARSREAGPPPSPPGFVAGRLALLEEWLNGESGRELKPAQQGALVMARIVEVLPFEDGNGRVARLAASHVMVRAGMRPPILRGADEGRLREALQRAFRFETEPLCLLLEEASERALDVMIEALAGKE
jgi:Fic family protein